MERRASLPARRAWRQRSPGNSRRAEFLISAGERRGEQSGAERWTSLTGRWTDSSLGQPRTCKAGSGGDERRRTGGSRGGGLSENGSPRGEKTTS
ncbi:hypothetical protein SRHO_G00210490 [Serrasalmus rhombeus]